MITNRCCEANEIHQAPLFRPLDICHLGGVEVVPNRPYGIGALHHRHVAVHQHYLELLAADRDTLHGLLREGKGRFEEGGKLGHRVAIMQLVVWTTDFQAKSMQGDFSFWDFGDSLLRPCQIGRR
jgi:hypothetical protein